MVIPLFAGSVAQGAQNIQVEVTASSSMDVLLYPLVKVSLHSPEDEDF